MNNQLLTVEDANSIMAHFGKGFCDYYTLDTRLLTTVDTWFAYDFIDVYRVTNSISFNIKNTLWTGGYRIVDCNLDAPSVSVSGGTIVISGSGLEWVVLILELSPEFTYDSIFELDYQVEYTPIIRPFYESIAMTMGFLDGESPVTGLSVLDKITGETLTTDSEGLITVLAPQDKSGDYDYILEAENNGHTVEYYFPYLRVKCDLPVILTSEHIFKNKKQLISFRFLFDDEYNISDEMLFNDNDIILTVNDTKYVMNSYNNGVFDFFVDLETIDTETVSMVLDVEGNEYLNSNKLIFLERLSYFTTDDESILQSELSDDDGADVIIFEGNELNTIINVDRKVEIRFTDAVAGGGFNINEDTVLSTPTFENVLIVVNNGDLTVNGGSFTHAEGIAIRNNGGGNILIKSCSFVDNYSCISSKTDVVLSDCVFELGDADYLDTKSVAFVECLASLDVNYCTFTVELDVDSVGFGYSFFKLSREGSVNGVVGQNLLVNQAFPTLKNVSMVSVDTTRFNVRSHTNKCIVWTIENTNTIFNNDLEVEYNV